MIGYKKISDCCKQAVDDGFELAWVDTCCIDKTSSAELSEAINSMYQWYQDAQVCYVYLADVPSCDALSPKSKFAKSRWFTRGWTLQELLAPQSVVFYSSEWIELGTKSSLQPAITAITGVSKVVLLLNHPGEISVAQRMSWAANRETTRVEDIAYCLLGLFGVNMPAIYGEGENAFVRLQFEILKTSDDESIFAWKGDGKSEGGMLARSPTQFRDSGAVERIKPESSRTPFSMTNSGLHIELPLIPVSEEKIFQAILNCVHSNNKSRLGIYLKQLEGQQFTRVHRDEVFILAGSHSKDLPPNAESKLLYVREKDPSVFEVGHRMRPENEYRFRMINLPLPEIEHPDFTPTHLWHGSGKDMELVMLGSGHRGALMFRKEGENLFAVMMGMHNYNTWCDIRTDVAGQNVEDVLASYSKDATMVWKNLDRVTRSLSSENSVSLAIKRGRISNQKRLLAEITVHRKDPARPDRDQNPSQDQPLHPQYQFLVNTSQATDQGFEVLEVQPPELWSTRQEMRFLSIVISGSGIILFRHRQTQERVAAMLGMHNYKVWSDVATDFGNDTADQIRASYWSTGRNHGKVWQNLAEVSGKLSDGRRMDVKTTEGQLLGEPTFVTTVTV